METTDAAVKPIIGLATYLEHAGTDGCGTVSAAFLPETYLDPIIAAGGVPTLLPPQPVVPGVIEHLVSRLDGLVIPGGWDVNPALYGQEAHAETDKPRPERDAWEQALIREALRQDIPLLCICRGEQLLNVTLGGTLHQHLPDVIGNGQYQLGGYEFNKIQVEIRQGSRLEQLIGANPGPVPVSHHQAVDKLGEGLIAAAWSEDQVVEAIEHPASTFAMGIQWHPEELPEDFGLFRGFIEAARAKLLSRLWQATPSSALASHLAGAGTADGQVAARIPTPDLAGPGVQAAGISVEPSAF
ncbi:gamma-glutamyl-gamma-aminobutyrate hydrolase family protein [Pseudarthrobacter sp. NamB4]|uniref:gamma-glutamyl-gamma-aminobutyrate hydrolase family protein n=1 Tax=Pseudarthrobacter sp. NamB4 TaxID=2576837 RepID=UPI0010FEE085|nr:gamma-glutamyl-gamma-aminobutyrate hydrolase family protein [Pseudarthrobacter sp. NamB4]TLM74555.1 gamma-glutamyl-gamma-aminobutyrate hydrolase family protein [Pseudarthrobacter sp. NamB4]